jgi:ABC-type uncharacterized transport system substrate-binding protein
MSDPTPTDRFIAAVKAVFDGVPRDVEETAEVLKEIIDNVKDITLHCQSIEEWEKKSHE